VDTIAGLTAVDGATVINDQYEVLAFGAKIGRPAAPYRSSKWSSLSPSSAIMRKSSARAAWRHSAPIGCPVVHDQRDALALVASQDGRFTIFAWSPCEAMVHAHRVDVLLL